MRNMELERIIAVAIRDPATGAVRSAPGAIHADLMKEVAPNTLIEEGHVTSRGRFVNRDEAARLNKPVLMKPNRRQRYVPSLPPYIGRKRHGGLPRLHVYR